MDFIKERKVFKERKVLKREKFYSILLSSAIVPTLKAC
jgi:hypothetical protein